MKHWTTLVIAASMLAVAGTQATDTPSKAVVVSFDQPEQFTDFRAANGGRNDGRTTLMSELERFIRERGELWLPPGHRLELTFHDIDMAGRIVPLPIRRNVGGAELGAYGSAPEQRVVESPWPPRLVFEYNIYNSHGELVRNGSADIVEPSFLRLSPHTRLQRRDGLWYEKAVLDTWMRENAS